MKIQQVKAKFEPITITLETRAEAKAFESIIDYADATMGGNESGKRLITRISDAFTNMEVVI